MARKDSLLTLHERLKTKRDDLRSKMSGDAKFQNHLPSGVGDTVDTAIAGEHREMNSKLKAFESRELFQIEKSLMKMRDGRYGVCDNCDKNIPIARLRALPYSHLCINCQREMEANGYTDEDDFADWENACDMESRITESDIVLKDLDQG